MAGSLAIALTAVLAQGDANPLTDEDRAIAQHAKDLLDTVEQWDMPENVHYDAARQQAEQVMEDIRQNPASQMTALTRPTLAGRLIIFASMSLGEQAMDDIIFHASRSEDVVVALRGVVDEKHFAKSIMEIQQVAAQFDSVANVVVDPTLFRDYGITRVPTIIYLNEQRDTEIARVAGLSSSHWMREKLQAGKRGDFGQRGPVEEILERDLIEVMKEKVAGIDWAEKKDQAIDRFWSKQQFITLPKARVPVTRYLDPSIRLTADIKDAEGQVIVPMGAHINPLDKMPFTQALVVFDPTDDKEITLVSERVAQLRKAYPRITLIVTRLASEQGWESYQAVTDHFDAPVFKLTQDVYERFTIERTPTVVTAQDRHFVIEELARVEVEE